MADSRCGIGQGFDNECPRPALYAAEWDNVDQMDVCEEHAALARIVSKDLLKISTRPPHNGPCQPEPS